MTKWKEMSKMQTLHKYFNQDIGLILHEQKKVKNLIPNFDRNDKRSNSAKYQSNYNSKLSIFAELSTTQKRRRSKLDKKFEKFHKKKGDEDSENSFAFSSWNSENANTDNEMENISEFKSKNEDNIPFQKFFPNRKKDTISKKSKKLQKQFSNKFFTMLPLMNPKKCYSFLIVDDNMFNIVILKNYLNSLDQYNIKVSESFNGLAALNLFEKFNKNESIDNIDIIIMDCEMPIMDGFQSSEKIKHKITNEGFINCIIIGFTGLDGEDEENKCISHGMDGYIFKPCSKKDFCEYMGEILHNFTKKLSVE